MRTLATIRMGRYGVEPTANSLPKEMFPKMAPIRPRTDWIPNAVDLREEGEE